VRAGRKPCRCLPPGTWSHGKVSAWTPPCGRTGAGPGQRYSLWPAGSPPSADFQAASLRPCAALISPLRPGAAPPAGDPGGDQLPHGQRADCAGNSWPSRLNPGSSKASSHHLSLSGCRQALGADCALSGPGSRPFPQPSDLPDAPRQRPLPGNLLQAWGFDAEKAVGPPARPHPFSTTSAPRFPPIHQAGGSRPAFSASGDRPTNGHSLYDRASPQTTNWFAWALGDHFDARVRREPEDLFWECRGAARSEASPGAQPSHRPGPDRLGIVLFQALKPAPAWLKPVGGDEPQATCLHKSFCARAWSWPCWRAISCRFGGRFQPPGTGR